MDKLILKRNKLLGCQGKFIKQLEQNRISREQPEMKKRCEKDSKNSMNENKYQKTNQTNLNN